MKKKICVWVFKGSLAGANYWSVIFTLKTIKSEFPVLIREISSVPGIHFSCWLFDRFYFVVVSIISQVIYFIFEESQ